MRVGSKLETEASKTNEAAVLRPAVEIKDVSFSYEHREGGDHHVLQAVNVAIPRGQMVGLVGRNASGKSTLLQIIRGVLTPQKGTVRVGDLIVSADGHFQRQPEVAIISQKPDACLAPTMTVYENFVISHRVFSSVKWAYLRKRRAYCKELLATAGMELDTKSEEQVRFLSGGQQQALTILLALESASPILLMDEPTAALDPFAAKKVLDLATNLTQERNGTIMLVSHRLRDILERCQRILVLNDGIVIRDLSDGIGALREADLLEMMSVNCFSEKNATTCPCPAPIGPG